MKINQLKKRDFFIGIACFIGSIFLMAFMSGFQRELYLIDDNRNQWYPIMEEAYDTFFSTGHMPSYDFYQMKGFEIADEGYYGLTNPIMLICYVLHKFVFRFNGITTITLYIFLMFAFGNVLFYSLSRKLGCTTLQAVLAVIIYSSSSQFISFGYWYYVFNNYFIIPLLFYTIIKTRNSKLALFAPGIVLAFGIYLGNAQYSVYQYLIYGLFMLGMTIIYNKKCFYKLCTNCIIGLLFSIPVLVLLITSSQRSSVYAGSSNDFFTFYCNIFSLCFMGLFPNAILDKFSPQLSQSLSNIFQCELMNRDGSGFLYLGGIGICCVWAVIHYGKKIVHFFHVHKKQSIPEFSNSLHTDLFQNKSKYYVSFFISSAIVALFLTSFVSNGMIAKLMSMVPIIKSFRFLFKVYFVLQPVLSILSIHAVKHIYKRKWIMSICLFMCFAGFISNFNIVEHLHKDNFKLFMDTTMEEQVKEINQELNEEQIDRDNYRIAAFSDLSCYDNLEYTLIQVSFNTRDYINRNIGTRVGVFTLNGYDFTCCKKSFTQSNVLMNDEWLAFYGNITSANQFSDLQKLDIDQFIKQVNENAVKYFIFDRKTKYLENFYQLIQKTDTFSVNRVVDFGNNAVMVELNGVDSLCYTLDNPEVKTALNSSMAQLKFGKKPNETNYRMSFTYKGCLKAEFIADDGSKKEDVTVSQDKDGYVLIHINSDKSGMVLLTYCNPMVTCVFVFSIITTALLMGLLFYLIKNQNSL